MQSADDDALPAVTAPAGTVSAATAPAVTASGATPVSVVVPVGVPDGRFDVQLRALREQRDVALAELVVAANGVDPDAVRAASTELGAAWPAGWSVRVVDATAVRGPSHARNVGWRAATHPVVLFCDADDRVEPGWLAGMRRGVLAAGICGGRLAYDALNAAAVARRVTSSTERLPVKFHHLPFTPSCSLGAARAVLEAVDGFDESLRCGEDIDLCWRAAAVGADIAFVPDAVVQYRLRAGVGSAFRQAFRYSVADARLLRAHRSAGARWTAVDSAREAGATVKAVLLVGTDPQARVLAATRIGAFAGRFVGSCRWRVAAF